VDGAGRALIVLRVRATKEADPSDLTAWVDTAFTGELVIPRDAIQSLGLPRSAAILAGLADGTRVVLDSYSCLIEWFGNLRVVEVVENDGRFPLLGIGLLRGRRLEIDYRTQHLVIE
jgi:clan AA aspartic protease